jgi:hypothetical protein
MISTMITTTTMMMKDGVSDDGMSVDGVQLVRGCVVVQQRMP